MRKTLVLFALCTAVLACEDARPSGYLTGPVSGELGTFVLRTVSGNPLPISLAPASPNTTRQLVADTLSLTGGGVAREIYYTQTTPTPSPTSGPPSVSSVALTGHYTITGDSLALPADFPYAYGRVGADTITMRTSTGFVYVYTRR